MLRQRDAMLMILDMKLLSCKSSICCKCRRGLTCTRSDATAGFGTELKDAATKLIWPLFANNVMTTDEFIATLPTGASK